MLFKRPVGIGTELFLGGYFVTRAPRTALSPGVDDEGPSAVIATQKGAASVIVET